VYTRYGLAVCILLLFTPALSCVPHGLQEKATIVGTGFLSRSAFYEHRNSAAQKMNYITVIQESRKEDDRSLQLALFDQGGLWLVDPNTRIAHLALMYKDAGYFQRPKLVDVDGDGVREIVLRGGGFSAVGLLDNTGKLLWKRSGSYSGESTANSMAVGDLDRDGTMEFYIAATNGLYSLATDGSLRWHIGDTNEVYWHVEVFDSEVSSERQVVAIVQRRGRNQPRFLEFRDFQGSLNRRIEAQWPIDSFRLMEWPTDAKRLRILARNGSALAVLDRSGSVVWEYQIPKIFRMGIGVEGTIVQFANDEEPYLAVLLGTRAEWRRSILCVFTLDGKLVYQELLGATNGVLATQLDGTDGHGEVLLVGDGKGRIYSYQRGGSGPAHINPVVSKNTNAPK